MSQKKNLIIINNEKVSQIENKFFCDNLDMKTIPEGLSDTFEILFIGRKSNDKKSHLINIKKIETKSNILAFLTSVLKTFKNKHTDYLLISITPYTFFSYLILFLLRKKIFVYLRSNGYEEYKAILGFIGPLIYHLMYICVTSGSKIILCQERLAKKKKSDLVFPSEIDNSWLSNTTVPILDKPRLLYIGRIKVEKGVFSLFNIYENLKNNASLTVVGDSGNLKVLPNKEIDFRGYGFNSVDLKKIYDEHNILILPSFTEAHPKVIDESLARMRPVIIFEEIKHVINNKLGIFISKRNTDSLAEVINHIMKNYSIIQSEMKKNLLPTKQDFINKMSEILR